MARKKRNPKNKSGRFVAIPHAVMDSASFTQLGGSAVKLLLDIAYQYNGSNNGDFTVAYGYLKKRGWRSKGTISKAVKELTNADLVLKTRQGKFQNPNACCDLYAITWQAIDECNGKSLEVSPTATPPRKFSIEASKMTSPKVGPGSVQKSGRSRSRDSKGRYISVQKQGR